MTFEEFAAAGPRLRAALVGAFGPNAGLDAASEALAYGWELWERVVAISRYSGVVLFDGETFLRGGLPTYTDPVPANDEVAGGLDGAGPTFTSADEVVDTIVASLQDTDGCENPPTATVVDRSDGDPTTVTIDHRHSCDDSVAGSLIDLTIARGDAGAWSVVSATQRHLCIRGAGGPDVCL